MQIRTIPVHDWTSLGKRWQALERRAAALSFFQSWSWVGCLAEERFPDPVLLQAEQDGEIIGLALFNRRAGKLCLGESGDLALDSPFVEHNAPLVVGGETTARLLRVAWSVPRTRRLVLSGVAPEILAVAGGTVLRQQDRLTPLVDLDLVRTAGGDHLAACSANARYQIRRSMKSYAARGALTLNRAADAAEALAWFDALLPLHTATWQSRGSAGAFASAFQQRFHRALIARAADAGTLAMQRVRAGAQDVGYLYNFRCGGRVSAYQSGFAEAVGAHEKPGLTCHALAVQQAVADGDHVYDFLAGDAQYKRSLANAEATLSWAELVRPWSPMGIAAALHRRFLPR